jgi:hypothetical protein
MAETLARDGAVHRVSLKHFRAKAGPRCISPRKERGEMQANALSADLDGAYPPAIACHHAMTDDVAAVVIVIGIVVVIGVRPDTKSHEPTTVKSAMEAVESATAETAMDAGTVEAASTASTHDSAAAHASAAHDSVTTHATATVTTHAATATAASQRRRRLNQADRGQC